ncbi:EamA family transporter [Microbacteriaceae bacterium 4G12]
MLTVLVGLLGALVYGAADFLGGLGALRTSALRVTGVAAVAGLVALLAALPLVESEWSASALLFGGISGVSGAIAISLLYACLAIGPMSILSPVTAVVSAVVPMTWGLLGGERLGPIGYLALVVALVAVVLVGFTPGEHAARPSTRGLLMAVGSGAMIGVFLVLIDQTPEDSGLVPLIANRTVNAVIMLVLLAGLALLARRRRIPQALVPGGDGVLPHGGGPALGPSAGSARFVGGSGWLRFALACGVVDAAANTLLLIGIRIGDLTVMSVLTAMYPAGTILLAAVVLRERIARLQVVGLVLALASAGMLALA